MGRPSFNCRQTLTTYRRVSSHAVKYYRILSIQVSVAFIEKVAYAHETFEKLLGRLRLEKVLKWIELRDLEDTTAVGVVAMGDKPVEILYRWKKDATAKTTRLHKVRA